MRKRSEASTRSGVLSSPSRPGSSPSAARISRTLSANGSGRASDGSRVARPSARSRRLHSRHSSSGSPRGGARRRQLGRQRRRELAPADQRDVLGGGIQDLEPGHVEIQVLVIQVPEQPLLGQLLQLVEVHHIAGLGIDLALDGQLQLVVVAVEVRVAALPERLPVPLVGEPGIVQAVGGVEVHAAGDGAAGHVSESWSYESGAQELGAGSVAVKRHENETTRSTESAPSSRLPSSRLPNKTPTRRSAQSGTAAEGLLKPNEKAWRPHHNVCLPPRGMTSATAFGPFIGPVGSITWLPATAHSDVK